MTNGSWNILIQKIWKDWRPWEPVVPDHFLRTKISPLVLDLIPGEDLTDPVALKAKLAPAFEAYRALYSDYYNTCKKENSPPMRDANPVVILYPGVGMFTFAKDKQTARVAAEFYINAIKVMKGAEAIFGIHFIAKAGGI